MRSLIRGLSVLECLQQASQPLRLTDLSEELKVERATLFRYCSTLSKLGYVHSDPRTKAYTLGPKVRELGYAAQAQWSWLELVRRHLPVIAEKFGGAASFAILEDAEVVYLERAVTNRSLVFNIAAGDRLPAVSTSIGKVLLAELDDDELAKLLESALPASKARALRTELRQVRDRGVAYNFEGVQPGINSAAVPVRDQHTGTVLGGINLAGSVAYLDHKRLADAVVPELKRIADEIMHGRYPQRESLLAAR